MVGLLFLCCFLCLTTLVKLFFLSFSTTLVNLYGREYAFGTGDDLTVIANMEFVILPNEKIKFRSYWIIFYAIVILQMVFKGSLSHSFGMKCLGDLLKKMIMNHKIHLDQH